MLFPPHTQVTMSVEFSDSTGALLDPSAVTLHISNSSADALTLLTYGTDASVIKDATGVYHCDYLPPNAGTYSYQWRGTGAVVAAQEATFQVLPSSF
jgi:hypothetical protein